jgi:hypothetical protein
LTPGLLAEFENELDPARPEGGRFGARVLAYGSIATVLSLEAWPGRVVKRVVGFHAPAEADAYLEAVARYHAALEEASIAVVATDPAVVTGRSGRPVVYLVQTRFPEEMLAPSRLRTSSDPVRDELEGCILEEVVRVLRSNARRNDGLELALEARLANFAWEGPGTEPLLLDQQRPLLRRGGALALDGELLRAGQGPLRRRRLRREGSEERDLHAGFRLERSLLEVLGSFAGAASTEHFERAISFAADWLSGQPEADGLRAPDAARVRAFVARQEAARRRALASRRRARFWATQALRRPYDWILPPA